MQGYQWIVFNSLWQ